MASPDLLLGEFSRTLDERHRLSIPQELAEPLLAGGSECILAKERPGCLSLWNAAAWKAKLDQGVELLQGKMRAGRLEGRLEEVQTLARLLSTRHRSVQITGRSRLLVPEGFREFLQLDATGELFVIGAGVCLEIWSPKAWLAYVETSMPQFRQLFDNLSS
jgi:MraZ protein